MHDMGATLARSRIKCIDPPGEPTLARSWFAFKPDRAIDVAAGDIVLAAPNIADRSSAEDALRHELIHAFDFARAEINPSDCRHVACSEIRAYHLSGECSAKAELLRAGSLSGAGSSNGYTPMFDPILAIHVGRNFSPLPISYQFARLALPPDMFGARAGTIASLLASAYMSHPSANWRRFDRQLADRPDSRALPSAGSRIPINRAMIAITTKSSIRDRKSVV